MSEPKIILAISSETVREKFIAALSDTYKILTAARPEELYDSLSEPSFCGLFVISTDFGGDGLRLCRELRRSYDIPMIVSTLSNSIEDMVAGLSVGDDCISPDCPHGIICARVTAKLRRFCDGRPISIGALTLDPTSGSATLKEDRLELTRREFTLLLCLATHADSVVSREELLSAAFAESAWDDPNALWLTLSRLKQKLKSDETGLTISSVRNRGYILEQL